MKTINKTEKLLLDNNVMEIIESIINMIAPSFIFSYYDVDDIKQEARIFALEALKRFDPEKGELRTFLLTHIKNRLINLRRDKLFRLTPPCFLCKHYDEGCNLFDNEDDCKTLRTWKKKKDVAQPVSYDVDNLNNNDKSVHDQLDFKHLLKMIDEELPIKLRRYYLIYLDGGKIDHYYKNLLLNEIKEIAIRSGVTTNL